MIDVLLSTFQKTAIRGAKNSSNDEQDQEGAVGVY